MIADIFNIPVYTIDVPNSAGLGGCYRAKHGSYLQRFRQTKNRCVKLSIFSYPYVLAYVLGAQKNRLIEMVLLSTHNICFG